MISQETTQKLRDAGFIPEEITIDSLLEDMGKENVTLYNRKEHGWQAEYGHFTDPDNKFSFSHEEPEEALALVWFKRHE